MDDDEFNDIADEDLMLAFTESSTTEVSHNSIIYGPPSVPQRSSFSGFPRKPSQTFGRPKPVPADTRPVVTQNRGRLPARSSNESSIDDIPSDAFDSSPERGTVSAARVAPRSFAQSQSQALRQTTLWGQPVHQERASQNQAASGRPYRGDTSTESPTHHELNRDELSTWVYPTNIGDIRDYQFTIVKAGLFNNTLVALPTGLGKTFIAATVILNFFRWTRSARIVFVAPTKPLASQQVNACLNVAGIPRSQTTLLTGETPPVLREDQWATKRLFFMTPQTLLNDLSKGYADPKSIALLVVDEAHRSTGDYAYVKVVQFLRRFSQSFRVLALTATPGSTVEGVQDVIDNLGISHVEIRTEDSLDIRQYVHSRNIDTVVLDPSDEIMHIRELLSKALKPLVGKLSSQNIYYGRDAMSLTTFGLLKAKNEWMNGPGRHVNQGVKYMMASVFGILQSIAHAIKLLNFHGIKPFYQNLLEFRSSAEEKGEKGPKYKRQLIGDENFQEVMSTVGKWMTLDGFVGHPKLSYLCDTLLNHFMDSGEGSGTRAIVFSEYRDSAEEIVRVLNAHKPLLSATVFVGQADSKRSEGMKQKKQIETIDKFKTGAFNVLVATSIGEEGLDIGQVDLIVCYDASSSPIRMLQRMGRTGRKRAGNIVLLLMKGKEEEAFAKAKDNYSKMQSLICEGSRFAFRHDLSTRIVPRDIKPEVDKRHVDIPFENTQDPSLPEPKKTAAGLRKKPAKKKFHMPDGVETGFRMASLFGQIAPKPRAPKEVGPAETDFIADVPDWRSVVLDASRTAELNRCYRDVPLSTSDKEEIGAPRTDTFPSAQRTLRPIAKLKHGDYTKRCVRLFRALGKLQDPSGRLEKPYGETEDTRWKALTVPPFADEPGGEPGTSRLEPLDSSRKRHRAAVSMSGDEASAVPSKKRPASKTNRRGAAKPSLKARSSVVLDDCRDDDDDDDGGEEEEEEDERLGSPSLPRAGRPRATTSKGRTKKGRAKSNFRGRGDHLEEFGDDCTRTSDVDETDGSDSGADLADFIVGDEITSSMMISDHSTSPTTCSPIMRSSTFGSAHRPKEKQKSPSRTPLSGVEKPFYVPVHFTQTQDSDDDLPDLDELLRKKSKPKKYRQEMSRPSVDLEDEDDDDVLPRPPATKRRAVVADSDEDDDG